MTKLVVPPMPEVYTEADTEAQLDAVRVYRLDELRAYARTGWHTAQREAALADELAGALEDAFSWLEAQPLMERMREMGSPEITKLFLDCPAALANHKEARNG